MSTRKNATKEKRGEKRKPQRERQRDIMLRGGWLSASEAARRIGVDKATIYRMVADGKVEAKKSGQLLYLTALSLAEHYKEAPPLFDRIMAGVEAADGAKRK
jgi:excisionase family DNA binding protein